MGKRIDAFKKRSSEIICDVDGNVSSKRVITFIVLVAVMTSWASDLFFKMETKEFIFEGLMIIILTGLGASTAEKFSLSRDRSTRRSERRYKYDSSHLCEEQEVID
jgi:hypothetical protein